MERKILVKVGTLTLLLFAFSFVSAYAYSYAGIKWSGTSTDYKFDSSIPNYWKTPIQNAENTWDNAGSKFRFNKAWFFSDNYVKRNSIDGSGGTIAETTCWYSGSTIDHCQTVFDIAEVWKTDGSSNAFDVQNVATHEWGHWLKLNGLYGSGNTEETMYYYISQGETKKRTLDQDDKNGIIHIYGS